MTKFASGKNAFAISDRSGFRYRYKDMRREWNGALVGRDEFEPKQPQLGPTESVIDAQALRDARPDPEIRVQTFEQRSNKWYNVSRQRKLVYRGGGNNQVRLTRQFTRSCGRRFLVNEDLINVTGRCWNRRGWLNYLLSSPRFDNTSITLDTTTDTFDEG